MVCAAKFLRDEHTVNVQNLNVRILACLDLVPLSNSSDFRQCLKSEQKGSIFRCLVWPLH